MKSAAPGNIVMFTDFHRGSYAVIGALYRLSLERLGVAVTEVKTPQTQKERKAAAAAFRGGRIIHNTIGPCFAPVDGAFNIAAPFHEWSEYPEQWAERLNRFDEVWVSSRHIKLTLRKSGVTVPVEIAPPALDLEPIPPKSRWAASAPFRFLACGEAHFRKGFHLLMEGFMKAFPKPGAANLTIKTSKGCKWKSPRKDINIVPANMPRGELLSMYRSCDVFVSASLGEGLGLPVAEAIMALTPVAANYWGGHKDILAKGSFFEIPHKAVDQLFCSRPDYFSPGQKCAYSSPEAIAGTLLKAVKSSPASRRKMAMEARRMLVSNYGAKTALKKLKARLGL
ncbi:MAG: glycosyltransferase [Nitrospinae bacterium]|nr:glycosyltransferase [Nitrospinota bacterium]